MVSDQKNHSSRHIDGGSDEIDAAQLAGSFGTSGQFLKTDGDSVTWGDPPEEFSFSSQHTEYADGLSDEEIFRFQLQAGEALDVERIDVRQKGGGSSSNFSVDVYNVAASTTIDSATLGSTSTAGGLSNDGTAILIRVSNSTGNPVKCSITVQGVLV